ncbi:putative glycosyltransferase EpsH [Lactococcus lactis]|nr:putative glycosyltransferase EpsH [Lactococcus lactis]
MEEKLREEFKTYNFDLNDYSWKEKLPSVTVEKSERIGNRPKISVIIANYNNSPYLERMMNSLVNQSIGIENLQILFVDDRSTDDSVDKVQTFMKKYPNIELYVLDENTGGAHGPRNVGLLYAKGEYLVILDADDWYAQRGLKFFIIL